MRKLSKSDIPTYLVSYRVRNKNKQNLVYIPTYIHVKLVLYLFKVLHYKFPKIIFIIFGAINKATHQHRMNIKQYWFLSFVFCFVDLLDNMWISKKHIQQQFHKTCEIDNIQRNKLYFDKVTQQGQGILANIWSFISRRR
jgi:hypothetical protein